MSMIAWALLWPPGWTLLWTLGLRRRELVPWAMGATGLGCGISDIITAAWLALPISAAWIIAAVVIWWWRRKDRKPALKSAGAKSRARLAAIVNRARDASRGARPVLRPVPGGAS